MLQQTWPRGPVTQEHQPRRYTTQDYIQFQKFIDTQWSLRRECCAFIPSAAAPIIGMVWRYRAEYGRGVTSTSLADSLGIPRETARRAVLSLVKGGKLVRSEDGLALADDYYEGFIDAMDRVIDCMIKTSRYIEISP